MLLKTTMTNPENRVNCIANHCCKQKRLKQYSSALASFMLMQGLKSELQPQSELPDTVLK